MINGLLEGNRRFVANVFDKEQAYFADLARAQKPTVLWIGCSDSRVPVNTITQTKAGEVFVHRNVANIVAPNDWNLSAVLEFSINHLNIPDIVVCGHYGCGGIHALDEEHSDDRYVPIWLLNARRSRDRVDREIREQGLELSPEARHRRIVEENVRLQLEHLREYPFVASTLDEGRLTLHGWVYDLETGAIRILA